MNAFGGYTHAARESVVTKDRIGAPSALRRRHCRQFGRLSHPFTTARLEGLTTLRPRHRFLPSVRARHLPARRRFNLGGVSASHFVHPFVCAASSDPKMITGGTQVVGRITHGRG